jgi:hypothetical protein
MSVVCSQLPRSEETDSDLLPPQSQSTLEGISDLLANVPTKATVDLVLRLFSMAFSFPTREFHPLAVLKTVILFILQYDSAAYYKREGSIAAGLLEH